MGARHAGLLALCLGLSLGAPALADVTPEAPKVAAKSSSSGKPSRPFMARPVVIGLLAALFLVVAGAAGANDKKKPTA